MRADGGGYPEKPAFRLPARPERQVRAACWHTSAVAMSELQDWQDLVLATTH
ncbi:hypothetical protein [Streptomyces siamensis]